MIALAERNTFAGAAEQMHLTQAAISQQVKRIEAQLGQGCFKALAKPAIDWLASKEFTWDELSLPLVLLDAP